MIPAIHAQEPAWAAGTNLRVRIPPHDSLPIPSIGPKAGRGDGYFLPIAPGRRRRDLSNPLPFRRRLVTSNRAFPRHRFPRASQVGRVFPPVAGDLATSKARQG